MPARTEPGEGHRSNCGAAKALDVSALVGFQRTLGEQIFRAICAMTQLQVTAVSSHLPVADEDENYTDQQLARFRAIAASLLPEEQPAAILNSAGVMRFGQRATPGDLVRFYRQLRAGGRHDSNDGGLSERTIKQVHCVIGAALRQILQDDLDLLVAQPCGLARLDRRP